MSEEKMSMEEAKRIVSAWESTAPYRYQLRSPLREKKDILVPGLRKILDKAEAILEGKL